MTNFEQFKKDVQTMSAEQFVEFMYNPIYDSPEFCIGRQCVGITCEECFCCWLNEEVKENNNVVR